MRWRISGNDSGKIKGGWLRVETGKSSKNTGWTTGEIRSMKRPKIPNLEIGGRFETRVWAPNMIIGLSGPNSQLQSAFGLQISRRFERNLLCKQKHGISLRLQSVFDYQSNCSRSQWRSQCRSQWREMSQKQENPTYYSKRSIGDIPVSECRNFENSRTILQFLCFFLHSLRWLNSYMNAITFSNHTCARTHHPTLITHAFPLVIERSLT